MKIVKYPWTKTETDYWLFSVRVTHLSSLHGMRVGSCRRQKQFLTEPKLNKALRMGSCGVQARLLVSTPNLLPCTTEGAKTHDSSLPTMSLGSKGYATWMHSYPQILTPLPLSHPTVHLPFSSFPWAVSEPACP